MCTVQVEVDVGKGAKNGNGVCKTSLMDGSGCGAEWNRLVRDDYQGEHARYLFRI
jgi:hypothetical protein